MADIVERLREHRMTTDWQVAVSEAREAADEIERLRQVLENTQQARVLQGKAIIDANNEIERLRAALKEIRDAGPMTLDDQRWRIALAALGGKND